jgi:small subunit ribosomal protein S1
LSLKALQSNPWLDVQLKHPKGSKVKGTVRSITEFGIFIGVEDGIDGLVHISDFSWTKRIKDPKEIHELFKKGDEVEALVLDVDVDNERLSLGIKQLESDPWEAIAQRYPVDSKVKGKISSITDFGAFVEIEEGVEGLIHTTHLSLEKGEAIGDKYKAGDAIEATVIKIERDERRISLSTRAIKRRSEKDDMSGFMEDQGSAVTFGDLIRQKMENN